jgi:hypothetical protein
MLPIQDLSNNLLYDISRTTIPTDDVDAEQIQIFTRHPPPRVTQQSANGASAEIEAPGARAHRNS